LVSTLIQNLAPSHPNRPRAPGCLSHPARLTPIAA
jgi:hypothetical protein